MTWLAVSSTYIRISLYAFYETVILYYGDNDIKCIQLDLYIFIFIYLYIHILEDARWMPIKLHALMRKKFTKLRKI